MNMIPNSIFNREILAEDLPLEEAQQVGEMTPEDTASTGDFSASLSGNRLTVTGEFSNLTSALLPVGGADPVGNPEGPIHIHIGEAGENGPIIRNLMVEVDSEDPGSGEFTGTFDLSDEQVGALVTDGLYVNLHTEANPSGELRGQIDLPETVMAEGIPLEESQQLNDVPDSPATGEFSVTLVGDRLVVSGTFSDLTSALMPVGGADPVGNPESAIHIHIGAAGENGPIIRNLTVDEAAGTFEGVFTIDEMQADALVTDGLYVNLHTTNFPSGELRGQIDVDFMDPDTDGGNNGGNEFDSFLIAAAGDTSAVFGGEGNEFVAGQGGDDNLLFGGGGNDLVKGDLGGPGGDDLLFGGAGDDLLLGEGGNDYLVGGAGDDLLFGGEGADIFALFPGEGTDIILDFDSSDLIGLGNGLSFGQVYAVQSGEDTVVGTFAGEVLAVVVDTDAGQFTADTFLTV